jgi:hypothetical protein
MTATKKTITSAADFRALARQLLGHELHSGNFTGTLIVRLGECIVSFMDGEVEPDEATDMTALTDYLNDHWRAATAGRPVPAFPAARRARLEAMARRLGWVTTAAA